MFAECTQRALSIMGESIELIFLTVRPCKTLKVMYVRGVQTRFGGFRGKTSYRDVR
jgi:hypothetical protein